MQTKDQRSNTTKSPCTRCGGKGHVTQSTKDGTKTVKCINCRGTGSSSGDFRTK